MKLKTLFIINAIVAGLFGLAFVIMPAGMMTQYGVTITDGGAVICRLFGAALLGFAIISLMARDAHPSKARKAIVTGFFLGDIVGCVIAIFAQVSGAINVLGWSTVAIYALLAIGFGVFVFQKEDE